MQTKIFVLLEIFRILRNDDNRKARKIIYEAFIDYQKNKNLIIFREKNIRLASDKIKGDLDEIGYFVERELIDESDLFELYSDVIRRLWISLEDDINFERNERKQNNTNFSNNTFMKYFESLATRAKSYRILIGLPEPSFIDFRIT